MYKVMFTFKQSCFTHLCSSMLCFSWMSVVILDGFCSTFPDTGSGTVKTQRYWNVLLSKQKFQYSIKRTERQHATFLTTESTNQTSPFFRRTQTFYVQVEIEKIDVPPLRSWFLPFCLQFLIIKSLQNRNKQQQFQNS